MVRGGEVTIRLVHRLRAPETTLHGGGRVPLGSRSVDFKLGHYRRIAPPGHSRHACDQLIAI